jgi:hypothetical protein
MRERVERRPMPPRQFVTELARLIEAEVWAELRAWFRRQCVERMLDAKTAEARESIALELKASGAFMQAVENEVSNNRRLIDGRVTRYKRVAGGTSGEGAGGSRRGKGAEGSSGGSAGGAGGDLAGGAG